MKKLPDHHHIDINLYAEEGPDFVELLYKDPSGEQLIGLSRKQAQRLLKDLQAVINKSTVRVKVR